MRTDESPPLGRHITPNLDAARLARQCATIARRLPSARGYRVLIPAAAGLACVVVLLLRLFASPAADAGAGAGAATVLEAPVEKSISLSLLDGSRVVLEPESKLSLVTLLARDIRLQLDRGGIELDVTKMKDRQFVVAAAGYEVRVVGTRFSVKLRTTSQGAAPALEVRVEEGKVRVARAGEATDVRVLGAGEIWSTTLGAVEPKAQPPTTIAPPLGESAPTPSTRPTAVRAPSRTTLGSKELWAQAESARAAQRFADAAGALDVLRLKHRADPRAGLAAFELGRLRQDTLHEPAGAAEAFADAIVLAPNGPFREDAEARRVEALEAAGDRARCEEAKAAFLTRYPGGIHRPRVARACSVR